VGDHEIGIGQVGRVENCTYKLSVTRASLQFSPSSLKPAMDAGCRPQPTGVALGCAMMNVGRKDVVELCPDQEVSGFKSSRVG